LLLSIPVDVIKSPKVDYINKESHSQFAEYDRRDRIGQKVSLVRFTEMAIIKVSIIPLGSGTTSISQYIARAVQVLEDEKDIKYELTAMGTVIEGELDHLLALIRKMHEATFDAGAVRAVTIIEIDDRRDKPSTISSKVESVKKKLGN
jgi:uncharacterized protein (TIGR00106 family)